MSNFSKILIVVLLFGVVAGAAYGGYQYGLDEADNDDTSSNANSQTNDQDNNTNQTTDSEFTSTKGVKITLNGFKADQKIANPLVISGKVPGSWSFEAVFPVKVTNAMGEVLGQTQGRVEGDWMTNNLVDFNATVNYDAQAAGSKGKLVIEKDNPSGLDENGDKVEVPVTF